MHLSKTKKKKLRVWRRFNDLGSCLDVFIIFPRIESLFAILEKLEGDFAILVRFKPKWYFGKLWGSK